MRPISAIHESDANYEPPARFQTLASEPAQPHYPSSVTGGRNGRGSGLRVLHVISAFQLGGAERIVTNLVLQHKEWGLNPAVVTIRKPLSADDPVGRHMRQCLEDSGIPIFEIGQSRSRLSLFTLPLKLARVIRRFAPDFVHSHTDVPDFVVSLTRRISRFRIARTIHSTSLWETRQREGWISETGLHDDLVIGVSEAALDSYRALRGRYRLPVCPVQKVVMNGVTVRPLRELRSIKSQRTGGRLKIAFFGRKDPAKGLDVLLDAMERLAKGPEAGIELSIFSDAAYDAGIVQRVSALGCACRLQAPVPNAVELMARFDAVVVPSRVEGLGLVAMEALAAHTPPILTDISGLSEVIPAGWPLLVPSEDSCALASMLSQVAGGAYNLAKLGDKGYIHVQKHSIQAFAQEYLNAYLQCLSPAERVPGAMVA